MEILTCYNAKVERIEGAPCGSQEEVLAWTEEKYGKLIDDSDRETLLAVWFFADNPPKIHAEYRTEDGMYIALAEVQ